MIPFYDKFSAESKTAIDTAARELAFSPSTDYGDYRQRAGVIQGLQIALDIAKDVETKLIER